jgi:hypothetical protein
MNDPIEPSPPLLFDRLAGRRLEWDARDAVITAWAPSTQFPHR